ncbi:exosome complex exonuclease rrp44 [Stylonychia lemnae]|uniref:Exosome complex exonuclease rrp44 n=1 Tax=Stylonychia lemnae TaxID=5949 RepID=A0A077ZZW2_STYLE|nr:exosome complex exonuclease rrp44 [Stylonychia lemnae]|eukprot:CDW74058.1 exosome complex exonuclease rrp44 [Stylonychia lemnae]
MLLTSKRVNTVKFRKLQNGKIVKQVEEQYIRSDIPCGIKNCPFCDINDSKINRILLRISRLQSGTIAEIGSRSYLISLRTAKHCQMQSSQTLFQNMLIESKLNQDNFYIRNIQAFHGLKNLTEQESRQIYYFYNENFAETFVQESLIQGKGLDQKIKTKVSQVYQWYCDHLSGITEGHQIFLLTENFKSKQEYIKMMKGQNQEGVISMEDFILMNQEENPELLNFMGFADEHQQLEDLEMEDIDGVEALYEDHLSFEDMIQGIKEGKYFQGRLNVSRVTLDDATVSIDYLNQDLLIVGLQNQNRALNGDIVCLEILPESLWLKDYKSGQPMNILEQEAVNYMENKNADLANDNDEDLRRAEEETKARQNIIDKINNEKVKRVTAKVMGVLKKMNKTYGGSIIKPQDQAPQTRKKFEQFIKNNRIDRKDIEKYRVFVPYNNQLPQALIKSVKPEALENKRLIVRYNKWSMYAPFPQGQFVKLIGEEGKIATESAMILHEFNVDTRPFSNKVLQCLPKDGANWKIPQEEINKRLDIRHLVVCSVDPIGCKDIDDALHCRVLPNGNYEVGVHIADVTHFVRPGSEIDKEAARRCTTVYMVERRTDMLPGLLTENLCSIRGGVERLVFSVIWEIDSKTILPVKTSFTKSVIKSAAALDYYTAQDMIDNPSDKSELTEGLRRLLKIATILRDRRTEKGALTLASPEIKFKMDVDRENPTDVSEYQHVSTHYMIEEFMLLANIAVAEKIVWHYPSFAILRRHPQPKQKEVQEFIEQMAKQGFEMTIDSSKSFAESLDRAIRQNDQFFNKIVRIMATRCMHQAVYFCLADFDIQEVFHYGLAVPVYTHFTSPIRRYADVLVHRLLAAAIDIQSLTNDMTDKFKMARQCDQMNRKNRMAALASGASVQFNTYLYFKNLREKSNEDVIEDAIVMKITRAGIYVMIKKYGIEGLLAEEEESKFVIDSEKEEAIINGQVSIQAFSNIKVRIVAQSIEFRRQIKLFFKEKVSGDPDKPGQKRKNMEESKFDAEDEVDLKDALSKKSKKKRRN